MNILEDLAFVIVGAFGVSAVAAALAAVKVLRDRLKRDLTERSEYEPKPEPKSSRRHTVAR